MKKLFIVLSLLFVVSCSVDNKETVVDDSMIERAEDVFCKHKRLKDYIGMNMEVDENDENVYTFTLYEYYDSTTGEYYETTNLTLEQALEWCRKNS